MRWLGQAQRAFDLMCRRANERVAFGGPLAGKQLVQKMVFDSAAEIQACRLLTLDAARKLDAGDDARTEIAMIKVVGAQMVHNVIDRAIQVHGAMGVTIDTPLERMYRHARFARHLRRAGRGAHRIGRPAHPQDLCRAAADWDFAARDCDRGGHARGRAHDLSVRLDGQTALVTGASSGIGRFAAKLLARCGARVAVAARRREPAASRWPPEIRADGGIAQAYELDVSDPAAIDGSRWQASSAISARLGARQQCRASTS